MDPRLLLAGLPNVIEGWDLDPAAVWIANVVLAAELLPLLASVPPEKRRPLPALAHVGDGLAAGRQPAAVVVMNPPYGRVHLSAADQERFADVLYGHANLYAVFMAAAVEQTQASTGVLAALVPTSWTAGKYFRPLRDRLSADVRLASVRFVEQRSGVFSSVLQETCLALFTRRRIRRTVVSSTTEGAVTSIATVDTPRGHAAWLLPRRSNQAGVAAGAALQPATLGSLGWRVSTGPLVWNRRKDDLTASPSDSTAHVLWASDIDGGKLHRDPRRDDKRFLRLHGVKDQGVMRLVDPAILVQRTAAPESPRKLVSAVLTNSDIAAFGGEVVVENHVNVVRPTTSPIPVDLMARVLATPTMDQVARCISGSVALSAFELDSLPMPDESTLLSWATLNDDSLRRAVARSYRPGAS